MNLTLLQCSDCKFIHAAGDELRGLDHLYERLEDPVYEQTQDSRAHQMEWLLHRIKRVHPGAKTLLDIGAGAGVLVRRARELGFQAEGVEPSRSLAQSASRINGVELLQGYFPHPGVDRRKFDVITLVDVIEHVPRPLALLRSAADALASQGILLVVTPDVDSVAARLLRRRWWHFRLAHIGYFSRLTLMRAGTRAHLTPVHVYRPKWFFKIEYVVARLEQYLPVARIHRLVRGIPGGKWLSALVVPVNTYDSLAVFFQVSSR